MHQLSASAHSAVSGSGGDVVSVAGLAIIFANLFLIFMRQRRRTSRRWPGQPPGGVTRYGQRDEISGGTQDGTEPDGQAPGAQPGWKANRSYWREESPGQHPQQEQKRSYWEPEQEDGTLAPNGFIGDPAQPAPPQADPPPGKPDAGADGPARW